MEDPKDKIEIEIDKKISKEEVEKAIRTLEAANAIENEMLERKYNHQTKLYKVLISLDITLIFIYLLWVAISIVSTSIDFKTLNQKIENLETMTETIIDDRY